MKSILPKFGDGEFFWNPLNFFGGAYVLLSRGARSAFAAGLETDCRRCFFLLYVVIELLGSGSGC
jgi:hypothetical protein